MHFKDSYKNKKTYAVSITLPFVNTYSSPPISSPHSLHMPLAAGLPHLKNAIQMHYCQKQMKPKDIYMRDVNNTLKRIKINHFSEIFHIHKQFKEICSIKFSIVHTCKHSFVYKACIFNSPYKSNNDLIITRSNNGIVCNFCSINQILDLSMAENSLLLISANCDRFSLFAHCL